MRLKELVAQFGAKKWNTIAMFMPCRTGRQCRDRYSNYLCPGYNNGQWSEEEDMLLKEKFNQYGPLWTKISTFFEGRTANNIKNRWIYNISKKLNNSGMELDKIPNDPKSCNEQQYANSMTSIPFAYSISYLLDKKNDFNFKE